MSVHSASRTRVRQGRGAGRPGRRRAPERHGREDNGSAAQLKARTHIPGFNADATPC